MALSLLHVILLTTFYLFCAKFKLIRSYDILYSQIQQTSLVNLIATSTNYSFSGDFCICADDFVVSSSSSPWNIRQIHIIGSGKGVHNTLPLAYVNGWEWFIWNDDNFSAISNSTRPGEEVSSDLNAFPDGGINGGFSPTFTMRNELVLSSGRYWISVMARINARSTEPDGWRWGPVLTNVNVSSGMERMYYSSSENFPLPPNTWTSLESPYHDFGFEIRGFSSAGTSITYVSSSSDRPQMSHLTKFSIPYQSDLLATMRSHDSFGVRSKNSVSTPLLLKWLVVFIIITTGLIIGISFVCFMILRDKRKRGHPRLVRRVQEKPAFHTNFDQAAEDLHAVAPVPRKNTTEGEELDTDYVHMPTPDPYADFSLCNLAKREDD